MGNRTFGDAEDVGCRSTAHSRMWFNPGRHRARHREQFMCTMRRCVDSGQHPQDCALCECAVGRTPSKALEDLLTPPRVPTGLKHLQEPTIRGGCAVEGHLLTLRIGAPGRVAPVERQAQAVLEVVRL